MEILVSKLSNNLGEIIGLTLTRVITVEAMEENNLYYDSTL